MKLLADAMLGRLARYCRMAGYDTAYALDRGITVDTALLTLSREEERLLLTRDIELATHAEQSILLESTEITDQLRELTNAGIALELDEPTRCSRCNGRLSQCSPDETPDAVPDPSSQPLWICENCGQYYWRGSHWTEVANRLESI